MAIAAVVVALYQHADVTKISSRVLNEGRKEKVENFFHIFLLIFNIIFPPNVKIHVFLYSPHYMPTHNEKHYFQAMSIDLRA